MRRVAARAGNAGHDSQLNASGLDFWHFEFVRHALDQDGIAAAFRGQALLPQVACLANRRTAARIGT